MEEDVEGDSEERDLQLMNGRHCPDVKGRSDSSRDTFYAAARQYFVCHIYY